MTIDDLTAAWTDRPVGALIDHIIARYHRPLEAQLNKITALTSRLESPEPWSDVLTALRSLEIELVGHMQKEERIIFPMVRSDGGYMGVPLQVMAHEHDLACELMEDVRSLTTGFHTPLGAPAEIVEIYALLATIDRDLIEHTALEDLLFEPARWEGPEPQR